MHDANRDIRMPRSGDRLRGFPVIARRAKGTPPMPLAPVVVDPSDLPLESFSDPSFGTVHWRTLFSGDRTATASMTCGLATLDPGGHLALHRHAPPEVYFGVSGTARIVVDGACDQNIDSVATKGISRSTMTSPLWRSSNCGCKRNAGNQKP